MKDRELREYLGFERYAFTSKLYSRRLNGIETSRDWLKCAVTELRHDLSRLTTEATKDRERIERLEREVCELRCGPKAGCSDCPADETATEAASGGEKIRCVRRSPGFDTSDLPGWKVGSTPWKVMGVSKATFDPAEKPGPKYETVNGRIVADVIGSRVNPGGNKGEDILTARALTGRKPELLDMYPNGDRAVIRVGDIVTFRRKDSESVRGYFHRSVHHTNILSIERKDGSDSE